MTQAALRLPATEDGANSESSDGENRKNSEQPNLSMENTAQKTQNPSN